jgi:transcriptional regulator with XRE-family HTH domain
MNLTPKEGARVVQEEFFRTIEFMKDNRYDSEIADSAGISRSLYSQMKGGHKSMSINSMVRIARVFDMDVSVGLVGKKRRTE